MTRQCFLRYFTIMLAVSAGLFIGALRGAPQAIFHADASMMTSAILALFLVAAARIGNASWRETDDGVVEFGHLAVRISVMLGFVGTAIGLSMQAQALASEGAASLGALSTSLFTTATGGAAAIALEALTHNLEVSTNVRR